MRILIAVVIALVIAAIGGLFYLGHHSRTLGPTGGGKDAPLAGCPATPNCVSSAAQDDHHFPAWTLSPGADWQAVTGVVASLDGTKIVENDGQGYLRAESRSGLFGFVDDLELVRDGRTLGIRSASRVGHSDLNANRERAEELGRRLAGANLADAG